MSKRQREEEDAEKPDKKQRKGFSVGPANLPDGTYRRKTQKIKDDLIKKAKVKKAYAKVKAREIEDEKNSIPRYDPYKVQEEDTLEPGEERSDGNGIHPERQAMLEEAEKQASNPREYRGGQRRGHQNHRWQPTKEENGEQPVKRRPSKRNRYQKELAEAEQRQIREQARQQAREAREKDRRAMAKARRPGKDGKQKLGRQSNVLLNRVRKLVSRSETQVESQ